MAIYKYRSPELIETIRVVTATWTSRELVRGNVISLLRTDGDGLTPLAKARRDNLRREVVEFLEDKTVLALKINEEWPGMSDEDFKHKFQIWEDL